MRVFIIHLSLSFILFSYASGQQSPVKSFGEVSMDELIISMCPYDSSATAMILFDKGDSEIDVGRGSFTKRHVRIKIFKKEAANEWAKKTIYFDKQGEFFGKFKASTYNLVNGKIEETKIGEDALFKDKYDKFTNQARFTLPQVNDGSVIEYTYTLSQPDSYALPSWQFQYSIPVIWSEFTTIIPTYFTFRRDWQGFLAPAINESKNGMEKIVISNAPAFKPEPSMTSQENYITKVRLYIDKLWVPGEMERSFIKTWGSVANSVFESDLFLQIKASAYLKKLVEEQTAGISDPEMKLVALYDFVKKSVAWNEFEDVIPDHQFKEVLEKKKGSSSEINGLLISLLMKSDLDARPVLLRTRDEGFIKPFLPVFSQFNYVICHLKIGEKTFLIDATEKGLPMHTLPERCLNGQGLLVVAKDTYQWLDISATKSGNTISTDFVLSDDASIKGKLTISREGNFANNMRKSFADMGQEKYLKSMMEGQPWEISKSSFENMEEYKSPPKETHEMLVSEYGQAAGSVIYINPIVYGRVEENPYKLEKRDYPVDFGSPFQRIYLGKITLPEGYIVEELPKSKIFVLPGGAGKYVYNVTTVSNYINVVSQFIINKSSFSTEEYLYLREFYTQVVAKQSEQVVLKRK